MVDAHCIRDEEYVSDTSTLGMVDEYCIREEDLPDTLVDRV